MGNFVADRMRRLDIGEGKTMLGKSRSRFGGTALSPVVMELHALYHATPESRRAYSVDTLKGLQGALDSVKYVREASSAFRNHVPQKTTTTYAKNAAALDAEKKGKAYWNTDLEKFARAFDAYVRDQLTAREARNTYLSREGMPDTWEPQGEERTAINAAFDTLVREFKVRQDGGAAILYQDAVEPAPIFYSRLRQALDAKMPNRATPGHVLAIVTNPQAGVKAEEVQWSGLRQFISDKPTVTKFLKEYVPGCAAWNASLQPESPAEQVVKNIEALRARGYPVNLNIVEYPGMPNIEGEGGKSFHVNYIPYQDWHKGDGDPVATDRTCHSPLPPPHVPFRWARRCGRGWGLWP